MPAPPPGQGRPEKGTPEYDWLYGSRRPAGGGADDETQVIRPGRDGGRGGDADAEHTRVMPAVGREPTSRPRQQPPPPQRPARQGRSGRSGPPPPAERARGGGRRRSVFFWIKLVLLLWLVFLLTVPIVAWTRVEKVDANPPEATRPDNQPGTTFLLVGSDSREDLTPEQRRELGTGNAAGRRTDTIMLLRTGLGPDVLTSIPRDSNVEVPGHGTTKINAAYAYGGPRLLVRTVEQNTGIRVDNYVEIGFGGFVGVVDALGGVEICPKMRMDDKQANLHVDAGCQEADGTTALGYARSRKLYAQRGDIDRAKAQREVISSIGDKALSPWTVVNPVRYFRVNMSAADSLRVGEETGPIDMARFAWAMTRVNGEGGKTCVVPLQDLSVTWDPVRSKRFFQRIIDGETDRLGPVLCTPTGFPRG